jgi:hypothetical protein
LYKGRRVGIVAVRIVTVASVDDQRIRPTVSSVKNILADWLLVFLGGKGERTGIVDSGEYPFYGCCSNYTADSSEDPETHRGRDQILVFPLHVQVPKDEPG